MSFDDLTQRGAAQGDPHGFLKNFPGPVVIDEVQLAPELLSAIKLEVDRDRRPGRYLLTGSANVLTLPGLSESLAGRMEIFTLFPLSQGELAQKREGFIDWLFSDKAAPGVFADDRTRTLWQRIVDGGYPEVIKRRSAGRKEAWLRDYVTTILNRDIRELANINGLAQMPRLLELLATRTTAFLNFAELARALQMPQTSLKRYLALFEATYLISSLPAWSGNLGKRITRTPKLFFTDTGLSAYLLGADADLLKNRDLTVGPLTENFVLGELRKQAYWSRARPNFFHFRSQTGIEVDFVLEDRRRRCVGIEVKAASTVRQNDFKGLRWLKDNIGKSFHKGVVLYGGQESVAFGQNLYAIPISALWQIVANEESMPFTPR